MKSVKWGLGCMHDGPWCGRARRIVSLLEPQTFFMGRDTQRKSARSRQVAINWHIFGSADPRCPSKKTPNKQARARLRQGDMGQKTMTRSNTPWAQGPGNSSDGFLCFFVGIIPDAWGPALQKLKKIYEIFDFLYFPCACWSQYGISGPKIMPSSPKLVIS